MADIIDLETGEIISGVSRIITKQEEYRFKQFKDKVKYYQALYNKYGDFFFYKYNNLMDDICNDSATAFRFLYLCTFADKDGFIITYDNKCCTTITDFVYIFRKSDSTVKDFCARLLQYELIYQDHNGYYRINENYFSHKLTDYESKQYSIRTFNRAIQELYKKMRSSEHGLGGELMKLVPYINIYNNTLCWNISEPNIQMIEPLTKADIQNLIRKDSDYGRKLYSRINNLTIHDEVIIALFSSGEQDHYIMNPRIFYRGTNINDLNALTQHFDIATAQVKKRKMRKTK